MMELEAQRKGGRETKEEEGAEKRPKENHNAGNGKGFSLFEEALLGLKYRT